MRVKRIVSTVALSSLASVSVPILTNAQVATYPLNRLFLTNSESVPLDQTLSFGSAKAVEDYFGATSIQATEATQYFNGYTGSVVDMLFTRFPPGGGRARLFSGNIANLSVSQLEAVSGSTLSVTSQGYTFSGQVNFSNVTSAHPFTTVASDIQTALDASVPGAAAMAGSSIQSEKVSFTGSVDQSVLTVNPGVSGYIGIGSYITVPGINSSNLQIVAQISGTSNGAGTYAIRNPSGNQSAAVEGMTDSYGELKVGSVTSGTVAAGQQITGTGVAPYTAIQSPISGSGAGSTWVLSSGPTQAVSNATLTTTAAPLAVSWNPVTGATKNSGAIWIEQWGTNDALGSSMTYAGPSAAATTLRLTQGTGARLSPLGEVGTSPSAFMTSVVQNEGAAFSSFQNVGNLAASTQTALQSWAQTQPGNGAYTYVNSPGTTTPLVAQFASNRLFLDTSNATPLGKILSFNSANAVANYYGASSNEAQLASDFFAGDTGNSANMLFALYPAMPWRANLYGGNVTQLSQLQVINNGSLTVTSDGLTYTAKGVNLSGVQSFSAAAQQITNALNSSLPTAAKTSNSSIASQSVLFNGSIQDAVLTVNSVQSGSIAVGSFITGTGVGAGAQITAQLSGTKGQAGVYVLKAREGSVTNLSMTGSYGMLTVGSVGSGTLADGEVVTGNGVAANTEIAANLSGTSGAGSTWVVTLASSQSVGSENLTMTGAPLGVDYNAITGATQNSGSFWLHGTFAGDAIAASTLSYATSGALADALGLDQAEAAALSQGGFSSSASDWMNNFVTNESNEFSSFQTTYSPVAATPPGLQDAMNTWAQSTGGLYNFLPAGTPQPRRRSSITRRRR
jgi:hypothetical protein